MIAALDRFSKWATRHPGAACPTASELALEPDPWGGTFDVTCTDQPGDQIIGLRSAGPDRKVNTDDDVASWSMGREVTSLVRGERWKVTPAKPIDKPIDKPAIAAAPPEPKPAPPPEPKTVAKPVAPRPTITAKPKPVTKPKVEPAKPQPPKPAKPTGMVDLDGDGIPDSRGCEACSV